VELGLVKLRGLERVIAWGESFLLRRFERVTSISARMCEKLGEKGVRQDRIGLLPNWVDVDAIRPTESANLLRDGLGLGASTTVALYAGTMGEKQGLDTLVEAAKMLQERSEIHFVFAGEGAGRARLQQRAAGLRNISFLPLQPAEQLNELLNLADVHLLPQRAGAADLVMPSKLTGMLASGRPVVAGAASGTQIADVVQHCGLVVPPENGRAMAEAVAALAGDPDWRRALGQAARTYAVEAWGMEAVLARFAVELEALASRGQRRSRRPVSLG
jgi:colanic acid biosynthesis glycosyl transferase WcaI